MLTLTPNAGAIMLFSGLGPDAQSQLSVGVGALAGSTIMLLTVPLGAPLTLTPTLAPALALTLTLTRTLTLTLTLTRCRGARRSSRAVWA